MRKGSVAIVPLIIALMLFFWFMWFLGGENDMLLQINKVENVQHIQEELIISAMQRHLTSEQDLKKLNPAMSDTALKQLADKDGSDYVKTMMEANKIQQ
jgi:hypothetical protein